ncbi:MAG TPA: hypothetical protein GX701_09300 [Clostridiales bacterium]|nr:hypothetical protein [Clostridiales bacterium]
MRKNARLFWVFLCLVMVASLMTGCHTPPEKPAQTTTDTIASTTPVETAPEEEKVDLEGYNFVLYGANDRYYPTPNVNQLNDNWIEEYAELEKELNCTFEAVGGDTGYENLLAATMADMKLGDVVITTQTNYFPGSIAGIFDAWDSEKLMEAGFDVNDAGKWNQHYTGMTRFNGYTWGVFAACKYITLPVGFFMVFNKALVAEAGVDDLYSVVRNGEWTWDKFLSICEAVTKDLDGDGQNDQWGIGFLPSQGIQMFTNGSGLVGERDGKWVYLGTEEPALESLEFLNKLYQGGYYNNSPDIDNKTRSTMFADGQAAFSWVAWYHLQPYGGDPYWKSNHDYGVIPVPKGPSADKYYTLYDGLDAWTIMRSLSPLTPGANVLTATTGWNAGTTAASATPSLWRC